MEIKDFASTFAQLILAYNSADTMERMSLKLSPLDFTGDGYIEMLGILKITSKKMEIKKKQDFKNLSYELKKQKIIIFLSKFEKNDEIFKKLIETIQKHKNINEKFLEDIYIDLTDFAELIKQNNMKKNQEKLRNI